MTARTTRTRAGALGLLAALVAMASLGACARGEALPPTEAPPNPTTPPALVDDPEVEAEIAAAFTAALDLGQPWTELRGRIDDGDDLEPTMEAVKGVISSIGASPSDVKSEISEVVITGDGTATIVATVSLGAIPLVDGVPLQMTRSGDTWLVSRNAICKIVAAGAACPEK
jgi:hypothetical protein